MSSWHGKDGLRCRRLPAGVVRSEYNSDLVVIQIHAVSPACSKYILFQPCVIYWPRQPRVQIIIFLVRTISVMINPFLCHQLLIIFSGLLHFLHDLLGLVLSSVVFSFSVILTYSHCLLCWQNDCCLELSNSLSHFFMFPVPSFGNSSYLRLVVTVGCIARFHCLK